MNNTTGPSFALESTFDTSQIEEGFEAITTSAEQWAQKLKVTTKGAASQTKATFAQISEDSKEMASKLMGDQLNSALSYRAHIAAQSELRAAQRASKLEVGDATEAIKILAAAQIRAAQAAKVHAENMAALGGASHAAVTGQQAASAAIRSLEGNAGLRAIENFVSKTLGLGSILQAAFPLIGLAAFGEMLFSVGGKLVDLEQKGEHAAEELARGFGEMNEKLVVSNDELALTNSKLEDQLGKLSGHPTNGLQTALLEAKVAADKLQEGLAGDLKSLNDLFKQQNVGTFESTLSSVGATGGQNKEIADYGKGVEKQSREARAARIKALQEAGEDHDKQEAADKAYYDRMAKIGEDAAAHMRTRAQQIADEQKKQDEIAAVSSSSPYGPVSRPAKDLTPRKDRFEDAASVYDEFADRSRLSGSSYATQKKIGQAKQDKAADTGDDAREQLKAIESQFAELNQATANIKGHGLTAEDGLAFWAPYLGTFRQGSDEAKKVLEEVAKYQDGIHKQIVDGVKKIKEEQARTDAEGDRAVPKGQEAAAKMLKEQSDDALRAGEKWQGYFDAITKGQEQAARLSDEIALTRVKLDEENGSLSHVGAAQRVAALHAKEHEDALRALRLELEKLQAEAKRDPVTGAVSDPKQAKQIQDVQNQIAAQGGKGQQQAGQDQKAIADAMAKPYLAAFSSIESGWMTAQNEMLRGNKNLAQSMKQMWSGIALDALQNIEKIGFNWARHQLMTVAQNAAAKTSIAATDSAAAGTSVSVDALAALKKMNHSAAVAAGKAWGAFADIPIVGPELGAVAAAATYSGVMALAAFEQGTMYVPRAGAAVLHPGEAVLGSPSAQVMRDAMSGKLAGAGGGGDVHLNLGGNTFHGNAGDFPAMLAKHESDLTSAIFSLHRRGKLKGVTS